MGLDPANLLDPGKLPPDLANGGTVKVQKVRVRGDPALPAPTVSNFTNLGILTPASVDVAQLCNVKIRRTFTFPAASDTITCAPSLPAGVTISSVLFSTCFVSSASCVSTTGAVSLTVTIALLLQLSNSSVLLCQATDVFSGNVGVGCECTLFPSTAPTCTINSATLINGNTAVSVNFTLGTFDVAICQGAAVKVLVPPSSSVSNPVISPSPFTTC